MTDTNDPAGPAETIARLREEAGALRTELVIQQGISADLRVESEARGKKLTAIASCGASTADGINGPGTATIGPCILRHGHDGPVHEAANGAKWWPNTDPAAEARAVAL